MLAAGTSGQVLTSAGVAAPTWTTPLTGTTTASATSLGVGTSTGSGAGNTAIGINALNAITTGTNNTAIGNNALKLLTTTGTVVAVGYNALTSFIAGGIAAPNVAVGGSALGSVTTGPGNTGLGYQVMQNSTTGAYNVAIGWQALNSSSTHSSNICIGYQSGYNIAGGHNIGVGYQTVFTGTGAYNTALGYQALYNPSGSYNVGIGYQAGKTITSGAGNIILHPTSSAGTVAPVFSVTTENDRVVIGSTSVTNAYIQVAWTVVSDARDKTNFAPVPHGLDFVNKLKPTAYKFKEDRETEAPTGIVRYGFLAQDILEIEGDNPVIIDTEDLNKLRFNSDSLIPVLVNAIQELSTRLDFLEGKLK